MDYDDLFISGVGSYLPKTVLVDDAIAEGKYDPEEQAGSGVERVTVAGSDDSSPEMAVKAGRIAVKRSGHVRKDAV